jgi:hypothetical protein
MASAAELAVLISGKDRLSAVLGGVSGKTSGLSADMTNLRIKVLEASQKMEVLQAKAQKTGTELAQLRADRAAQQLKALQDQAEKTGSHLGGLTSKLGGLGKAFGDVTKIAGGFVMAQGIMKAPGFFMEAAQAAADDAASVAKLQTAVENSGASWDTYQGQLNGVIEAAQKRGFTDDQARDALALLTAQTGDAGEAAKRFAMAQDLARGANVDVYTASKLLGKVTEENVNVFARYGIKVAEGASEAELFGAIQQKFGGQAETYAKSTAGQMEAAKIQMGELKEKIGYAVLPIMTKLVDVVTTQIIPAAEKFVDVWGPKLTAAFSTAKGAILPVIEALKGPLRDVFDFIESHKETVVGALAALGIVVAATVVPAWLAWAAAATAAAIATLISIAPILAIIAAGVLLGLAIKVLIDHWDEIKEKTLEVWGTISDFLDQKFGFLRGLFETAFAAVKRIVEFAWKDIQTIFQFGVDTLTNIFAFWKAIFTGDWGAAWQAVKDQFGATWDLIKGLFENRLKLIGDIATYALAALKNVFTEGFTRVKDAVLGIMDAFRDFLTEHWKTIVTVALAVLFPPGAGLFWIVTHFQEVKDAVLGVVRDLGSKLTAGFQFLVGSIVGIIGDLVGRMYDLGRDMIQRMIDGIASMAGSLLDMARDLAGQIADLLNPANWLGSPKGLQNWLPYYFEESVRNLEQTAARLLPIVMPPLLEMAQARASAAYQMGTSYVPATGIYQLHRGEAVLTAGEAGRVRRGDDQNGQTIVIKEMNVILPDVRDPDVFARRFGPAMSRWISHEWGRQLRQFAS